MPPHIVIAFIAISKKVSVESLNVYTCLWQHREQFSYILHIFVFCAALAMFLVNDLWGSIYIMLNSYLCHSLVCR